MSTMRVPMTVRRQGLRWGVVGELAVAVGAGVLVAVAGFEGAVALAVGGIILLAAHRRPTGALQWTIAFMLLSGLDRWVPTHFSAGSAVTIVAVSLVLLAHPSSNYMGAKYRRAVIIASGIWASYALILTLIGDTPFFASMNGIRLTFLGVLFLLAGGKLMAGRDMERLLFILVPLVVSNAVYAIWQFAQPPDALVLRGYEWAGTVRTVEGLGITRGFGFFPNALTYGHTMGCLALAYLAFLSSRPWVARDRLLLIVGAVACLAGVAVSQVRSAIVALLVAVILVGVADPTLRRSPQTTKVVGCVAAATIAAVAAALLLGNGSIVESWPARLWASAFSPDSGSLPARLELWRDIGDRHGSGLLVGSGPATAGASAVAHKIDSGGTIGIGDLRSGVTDNYYLATALQYGVVGIASLAWILASVWNGAYRRARLAAGSSRGAALAALGCISYMTVAMAAINMWEDFPTAAVVLAIVGAGALGPHGPRADSGSSDGDSETEGVAAACRSHA